MYGFDGAIQQEQAAWREAIVTALDGAHVPFVLADASVPVAMLQRNKLVIVPTFDFIDRDLAERLRAYAAAGGQLVSGPRAPSRDEAMQKWDGSLPGARLDASLLEDPRKLQSELAALAERAGARRPAPAKEPTVDTALHVRADGTPALLFVGTRASEPGRATVELEKKSEVEDVLSGERWSGETLSIPMAPYAVRMLRFS
jgi:beta-galactosidase